MGSENIHDESVEYDHTLADGWDMVSSPVFNDGTYDVVSNVPIDPGDTKDFVPLTGSASPGNKTKQPPDRPEATGTGGDQTPGT